MSMILAIDTSGQDLSLALTAPDGACIAAYQDQLGRGHGERILPALEAMLSDAGKAYSDVRVLAVATGPGSFTGLRVGLSVARGLALGLGAMCVGVSVLQLMAAKAQAQTRAQAQVANGALEDEALSGLMHVGLPTRGDDVFYQAFEGALKGMAEPARTVSLLEYVCSLPLPRPVGEAESIAYVTALQRADALPGRMLGALAPSEQHWEDQAEGATLAQLLGAAVAGLLERSEGRKDAMSAAYPPEPLYIRPADAAPARILLPVEGVFS